MTQRAGDPDAGDGALVVELGANADDRILAQQLLGPTHSERIVNQKLENVEPVKIDFNAEIERFERLNLVPDQLVQAGGVGPKHLIAERIVTKDLLALTLQIGRQAGRGKLSASREG